MRYRWEQFPSDLFSYLSWHLQELYIGGLCRPAAFSVEASHQALITTLIFTPLVLYLRYMLDFLHFALRYFPILFSASNHATSLQSNVLGSIRFA